MRKLVDLTKGKERVFIALKTPHSKAEFLKQATEEGFMLGDNLPANCKCGDFMIIHSDYTMSQCTGVITWMALNHSEHIDFEKYMSGSDDYVIRRETNYEK